MTRAWRRFAALAGRRLLVAALAFAMLAVMASGRFAAPAVAASPSPLAPYGDTRTSGEGAGLVGSPIAVALAVALIGLGAAGATILYVRLGGER